MPAIMMGKQYWRANDNQHLIVKGKEDWLPIIHRFEKKLSSINSF